MILKGLKFGMILQIAVGPVCLLIFQTSIALGLVAALTGVLAVTLIDTLFILAAIWGIGSLLERNNNLKIFIKYFGAFVLMLFGLSTILGALGISILPTINFFTQNTSESVFVKLIILTLSNPLTILFWAGVFSTKIVEENMNTSEMYYFGIGAVLSTILFLSSISVLGQFINVFVSDTMMTFLNIIVGMVLIAFGIKTAKKAL